MYKIILEPGWEGKKTEWKWKFKKAMTAFDIIGYAFAINVKSSMF